MNIESPKPSGARVVDKMAADGLKGLGGRAEEKDGEWDKALKDPEACMRVFGLQEHAQGPDAYTEKISQGPRLTV